MGAVSPTRVIGGRYVVLSELGRGGMGIVWRAEDRVMSRHVAVKELHLPPGLSSEERGLFRERLLREARTAGRLNDPGIVTVYDVVTDNGVDHIVMELIEARTLADVVSTSGPLDERAATTVAQQLLSALRAAHGNGVVHRDVKPSNVMLGPGARVRLTDFGIAQAADDPRLTTTGSIVGSPGYLSPERLSGGPATPASDLWALGATLFHAVRGSGPFTRDSTPATIYAVLHAEVPPVRTRGSLGAVIAGLLQREPQTRLSGVQAEALLSSDGPPSAPTAADVETRSVTGRMAALPVGRRPWAWAWAAAALVLGLVAGVLGGLGLAGVGAREVTTLTYGEGGDVPVYEISGPACLSVRPVPRDEVAYSATVSCDEAHLSEVFGVWDPFGTQRDLPYPGRDELADFAMSACGLLFDSGLVVGDDKSRLAVAALVPSDASFRLNTSSGTSVSFGAREVYCLLRAADGGQLRGTRIAEGP